MRLLLISFLLFQFFFCTAQHQDKVDFKKGDITIDIIPKTKQVSGTVLYAFDVLADVDSVFLDAKNMQLDAIRIGVDSAQYKYDGKRITIQREFKKEEKLFLAIEYTCSPKQTVYFSGWDDNIEGNEQVWTQGQGKYTSHWLPSFDDMEEKIEFDLTISLQEEVSSVIANGKAKKPTRQHHTNRELFSFDMKKPMSSYLLAFAVGDYEKQVLQSESSIPLENYYYPKDSLKLEPTYRYTKEIFDFMEKEIGYAYPWQNYKQVPVHDFLYAGMENTTTTIFSDQFVIDSTAFVDKNYVNVNAHELAHQWFGNLVTEKNGNHHWLHEGFATYYAYLAEQHLFGDDHFYWKFYKTLKQLKAEEEKGNGQSLLDPKASSLTFYEKGAWALFVLRNKVGDEAFKAGIKTYLKKYQFGTVTVPDFLKEMEASSGLSLEDFEKDWLERPELPYDEAFDLLKQKSLSIQLLSDMGDELEASQSDDIDYSSYWDKTNSVHFKSHMLTNFHTSLPLEIYDKALSSDTALIRQAILSPRDLNPSLNQTKLESFLMDESYVTQEMALFQLWQSYPQDRAKYLEATKHTIGLPNKSFRLLWLTLAMLTENYNGSMTKKYFDELSSYTETSYSFEVRQGAFFYLKEAFGFNDASLMNLIKATNHHSWQFKKFARNLLNELLTDGDYKARLVSLYGKMGEDETRYLKTKIN